jgi:uncharacterized membrane protein
MKVLQSHKKKTSLLRVIASVLAGTVLITPLIAFSQVNISEENESASLKIKESSATEVKPGYDVPVRSYGFLKMWTG